MADSKLARGSCEVASKNQRGSEFFAEKRIPRHNRDRFLMGRDCLLETIEITINLCKRVVRIAQVGFELDSSQEGLFGIEVVLRNEQSST